MSTHPERTSLPAATSFVSERPLPIQEPLTGETIDRFDAGLCAIAACIPLIPAKALTGPARILRRFLEEGHHAIRTHNYRHIRKELTVTNAIKLAFAIF